MYTGGYNYRLTPHFRLSEFIVSSSRPDLAKKIRFNKLDGVKALYMAFTILEPVRVITGAPIKITSGKCSPKLNKVIPGRSKTSDHLWDGPACAVDFIVKGPSLENVYMWIKMALPAAFGQLIYYPNSHIHVSLPIHKHCWEAWKNGDK